MTKITMYSKDGCPWCVRAKKLLDDRGIAFETVDVAARPEARDEMVARGALARTVPQVFADDRYVGDCERLLELDAAGRLEDSLGLPTSPRGGLHAADPVREIAIIGSGPAGLTAALYAARANLKPILFAGIQPGGQLTITTEVENYPGFPKGIQGPELMEQMREQALRFEAEIVDDVVERAYLAGTPKILESSSRIVRARSVVIATGASARWLGLPSEKEYAGKGVSACATCDGFFFRNEDVAVVGGGDTAMEEALYLVNFCRSVTVIHRRDEFRASRIMRSRVVSHPKIRVVWDSVVEEVVGDGTKVTGLRLRNVKTNAEQRLDASGLFVAIGHKPNTDLFRGQMELDETGYIVVPERGRTATALPGVFAAGDVRDREYRQAVTAAGMGCMAAIEAERYLATLGEPA